MPLPLVSIVIPTYNRLPIVCRAIESSLSQSYANIECIVIDDCSEDGTFDVLSTKYASRVVILQNDKNFDKSYSRNKGINHAKGKFICFLDSDDELTKTSVENRVKIFLENPSFKGVSFGLRRNEKLSISKMISTNKLKLGDVITLDNYIDNFYLLSTNSYLISKDAMLEFGMYNESIDIKEDIELFLRLMTELPFKFCGSIVTIIHQDAKNRARNNNEQFLSQKHQFSALISDNKVLLEKLGSGFSRLQKNEHNEILRALYYTGKGAQYRQAYSEGIRNNLTNHNFKFLKRYFLSYLKLRK